jgi:hypothetical protein
MKDKQIVIYNTEDGKVSFDVNLDTDTVWLTQKQISELFGTKVPAISKHIKNIFDEGELFKTTTVSKMEIVQKEGSREVKRNAEIYNLDMVLSIGYRVNSKRATQFRQWATRVLREYMIKGYSFNERRIKALEADNKQLKEKMSEVAAFIDMELKKKNIHLYSKNKIG